MNIIKNFFLLFFFFFVDQNALIMILKKLHFFEAIKKKIKEFIYKAEDVVKSDRTTFVFFQKKKEELNR